MLAPRPNYGITRIDQPSKRSFGYYVRLRHGKKAYEKFFSDKSCGGKPLAIQKARIYRDEVLATFPEERQRSAATKKRHIPQSGILGITHVATKDRHGEARYYYWQASWKDENGVRRTRKFSIARHGNDEALQKAKTVLKSQNSDRSE